MDVIYWTARIGLVALWLGLAVIAWPLHRTNSLWKTVAIVAAGLASIRATVWNFQLVSFGSQVLHDHDLYDDRVWAKAAMFIVVATAAIFLLRWFLRATTEAPKYLRISLASVLVMGVLVFIFPVEEVVPLFLYEQPGRYLLEYAIAIIAIAATLATRYEASR